MPYSRAWCVAERQGSLAALLQSYKFERAKAAHVVLAELLNDVVPVLPPGTVVVSVPTIRAHVRRRGYDHAELIAKAFARHRNLPYKRLLYRINNSVQLGATKEVRHQQASVAFAAQSNQVPAVLLVDDVFTTGSTAYFASQALQDAGCETVFLAIIARQPLEKLVEY